MIFSASACGALIEATIKKVAESTTNLSMAPFNPLSAAVAVMAIVEYSLLAAVYFRKMPLVEVVVLQVVYYFVFSAIIGRLYFGEEISLPKVGGMVLALCSIVLMTWDEWSWTAR